MKTIPMHNRPNGSRITGQRKMTREISSLISSTSPDDQLTAAEEAVLIARVQAGDQRAFDRIVQTHLRFVVTISKRFQSYGVPFEDLVSEGVLGLCIGVRNFRAGHGTRVATYAAWWIRSYMRRYTIANRRIVPPPDGRKSRKAFIHTRSMQEELTITLGEPPSAEQVALALGVDRAHIEETEAVLSKADLPMSTVGYEDGYKMPPGIDSDTEAILHRHYQLALIDTAMRTLSKRHQDVIRSLYFCPEHEAQSLGQVAPRYGLSRERVRQIAVEAIGHIRETLYDMGYLESPHGALTLPS